MHLNDTVVFLAAILMPQSGMGPGSSICAQNPGSQAADAGWSTVHTWRELSSLGIFLVLGLAVWPSLQAITILKTSG